MGNGRNVGQGKVHREGSGAEGGLPLSVGKGGPWNLVSIPRERWAGPSRQGMDVSEQLVYSV